MRTSGGLAVASRLAVALAAATATATATGCREDALPEIGPGRLERASTHAGRSLSALVPDGCRAGEVFRRQPDGEAALLVFGTGLTRADTVHWNGRPLKTTFGNSRLVTASIPPGLLASPGEVDVTVVDALDPSRPKLRGSFRIAPGN